MFIINNENKVEIIEKKSKFITRIMQANSELEIKKILTKVKSLEKHAVHNCYAYRILSETGMIIERKSDDGEPGGTAGAPMLAVLTGEAMINTIVITSRYFGGIKLGTGGLVNVYKRGVVEVLKSAGKLEFIPAKVYKLIFPINYITQADYILKKQNIKILSKIFDSEVTYIIEAPKNIENRLSYIVSEINGKILQ